MRVEAACRPSRRRRSRRRPTIGVLKTPLPVREAQGRSPRVVAGADRAAPRVEAVVAHGGPGSALLGGHVGAAARWPRAPRWPRSRERQQPGRGGARAGRLTAVVHRVRAPLGVICARLGAHTPETVAICALWEWRTGASRWSMPHLNRVDARAAHTAHRGAEIDQAALALLARHGAADPRASPAATRRARGRRGRLPARARDPADEGADHARGGARPVAQDRRQARGVRAAPPARPPDPGHRATASRSSAAPPRPPRTSRPSATSGCARAPRRCAGSSRRRSAAWCCRRRGCRIARSARRPGSRTPRSTAA